MTATFVWMKFCLHYGDRWCQGNDKGVKEKVVLVVSIANVSHTVNGDSDRWLPSGHVKGHSVSRKVNSSKLQHWYPLATITLMALHFATYCRSVVPSFLTEITLPVGGILYLHYKDAWKPNLCCYWDKLLGSMFVIGTRDRRLSQCLVCFVTVRL